MYVCTYRTPETRAAFDAFTAQLPLSDSLSLVVVDLCRDDHPHASDHIKRITPSMVFGRSAALDDITLEDLAMFARSPEQLAHLLTSHLLLWGLERAEKVLVAAPEIAFVADPASINVDEATGLRFTARGPAELWDDDLQPSERDLLQRGCVNERLVAATRTARPILEWWARRCTASNLSRRAPLPIDHPFMARSHRTHDIRWIDAVALKFDVPVRAAEEGWGLSPWNLGRSPATVINAVDMFGHDPTRPWIMSVEHLPQPRARWSEHLEIRRATATWLDARRASAEAAEPSAYLYDRLADGTPVSDVMRRTFDRELSTDQRAPLRPFSDPESFLDWLASPRPGMSVNRTALNVWQDRMDLRQAFPHGPEGQPAEFFEWMQAYGGTEERLPERLLEGPRSLTAQLDAEQDTHIDGDEAPPGSPAPPPHRPGVVVSGYFSAVMGLGEAARLVASAVAETGLETAKLNYTATTAHQAGEHLDEQPEQLDLDTHVACVNIDTFQRFAQDVPELFDGRYTIGLWFWETSIVPDELLPAFDLVDEIWVAAQYVGDIFRQYTDKPIKVFPQPVPVPESSELSRSELGLPDEFTFLFAFDFNSVLERKNPIGIIDAFTSAFEPGEGPQLVLKTINGHRRVEEFERLCYAAGAREDIHVVDAFFPAWKRDAWTAACDCYVSLHRSEGFGLTMAEAMASGKPVIATRFSANLEFMDDDNSMLVDVGTATVPAGCAPYPEGATWAAPDVSQAAQHMRRVYEDAELRDRLGAAARARITTDFTSEAMARWVAARISERAAAREAEVEQEPEQVTVTAPARSTGARRLAGLFRREG